jgi:multidrug resistance efflux pump
VPIAFSRSLRALGAERLGGTVAGLVVAIGLLAAWALWLALGRVALIETSVQARVEVAGAAVPVAAKLDGHVLRSGVVLGRRVASGEAVLELDSGALQLTRAEAEAQRQGVLAELGALAGEHAALSAAIAVYESGGRTRHSEASASAQEAELAASFARELAARSEGLRELGVEASEATELLQARERGSSAMAVIRRLQVARTRAEQSERLATMRVELAHAAREEAALRRELAVRAAAIATLDHQIAQHTLQAPIAGTLGGVAPLQPGAVLTRGSVVALVIPDDRLRVGRPLHARGGREDPPGTGGAGPARGLPMGRVRQPARRGRGDRQRDGRRAGARRVPAGRAAGLADPRRARPRRRGRDHRRVGARRLAPAAQRGSAALAMSSPRRRRLAVEVIQSSAMDCGPAALKCLLAGHGLAVSYGRLREACQTDVDGTSIDTLEEVAVALGLAAEQRLIPVDHLFLPEAGALPALAVVRSPGGLTHFVVVWSQAAGLVQIMDPALGRRFVRAAEFASRLFVHRMPVPAEDLRGWLGSSEFTAPLRRRARALGLAGGRVDGWIAAASADPEILGLAGLDAALRLAASLVDAGAVKRGGEAARFVEQLLRETAGLRGEALYARVPESFFTAVPGPEADTAWLRGAVIVRVRGVRPGRALAAARGRRGRLVGAGLASRR